MKTLWQQPVRRPTSDLLTSAPMAQRFANTPITDDEVIDAIKSVPPHFAAGAWTFTNASRTYLMDGSSQIGTSSYKLALFTNASNLGSGTTTYAGVTSEVGTTNTGYTTGGITVTPAASGTTTVTVTYADTVQWTAGSANLTAKFAAIYVVAGKVIVFCTLDSGGADVTATSGNTLTITPSGSGVFTLA